MVKRKGQQKKTSARSLTHHDIHEAALRIAAKEPWEFVTLAEIAEEAGAELPDVTVFYPDKPGLLHDLVRSLDAVVLASFEADSRSSCRDNLFDVLMERFDAMNADRAAHISFLKSFAWNNREKFGDLRFYGDQISSYASVAGIDVGGIRGRLMVSGIAAGYLWVLFVWMQDSTSDMGKTMKALDQMLGRLEWFGRYSGLLSDQDAA